MLQPSHSPPFFDFLSQEQEKSAQVSRRVNTISEVSENVKRMDEFLESYRRGELSPADQDSLQVNALFPPCPRGSIPCRGGTDRCVCVGGSAVQCSPRLCSSAVRGSGRCSSAWPARQCLTRRLWVRASTVLVPLGTGTGLCPALGRECSAAWHPVGKALCSHCETLPRKCCVVSSCSSLRKLLIFTWSPKLNSESISSAEVVF